LIKIELKYEYFNLFKAPIQHMCDNFNGSLLCTISLDKSLKVFDVINFDMINMIKLDFVPLACSFIHSDRDPISAVCVLVNIL
jgi:peptidylprolyl isomerase domain and WD repeat-containing protein 1